jgi:cytochrome c oxidase subunit 2
VATWVQLRFQDSSSILINEFINFHDYVILFIIGIITIVSVRFFDSFRSRAISLRLLDNHVLETFWTLVPAFILVIIAAPSLSLLYIRDELRDSDSFTIKVVGHQWFWRYEYSDLWGESLNKSQFDSYLSKSTPRLLTTDNYLALPMISQIRVLVTREDVLHSWALPRAGVKLDACPGRLNHSSFLLIRPGVFFGQCSEICGANHRFIPIAVVALSPEQFIDYWVKTH